MQHIITSRLGTRTVSLVYLLILLVIILSAVSNSAWAVPFAYIANFDDGKVVVLDTATNTIVNTITVGTNPYSVFISPNQQYAYVPNNGDNSVSVINLATNTVIKTITGTGTKPTMIAITPDGTRAYVTNNGDSYISIIDTASNTITGTVSVGYQPFAIAITPDGKQAYVANQGIATVSVVDLSINTVTANINVGNNPSGVFITPDGTQVYVSSPSDGTVSVINSSSFTVTNTLNLGGRPFGMVFSQDGNSIYIANFTSQNIAVVDTNTNSVTAIISDTGNNVSQLAITPDGGHIYATHEYTNSISIANTNTNSITNTIPIGNHPVGLAIPQGLPVARLSRIILNPNVLSGGNSGTGTIKLAAAFTSDTTVALTSSDTSVTVPASVIIHAGNISASFSVVTSPVLINTSVTLSGTLNGGTKQADLMVTPSKLVLVKLSPNIVIGGKLAIGKVTLSIAAPTGGFTVTLSSSNTAIVSVPSSVIVPAGALTATFSITSIPLAAVSTSTITAVFGGANKSALLTVEPPTLALIALKSSSVIGGVSDTGTVKLTGMAPAGGVVIALNSSAPSEVSVLASVTVPAGAISATFSISTVPVGVNITVGIHGIYNGVNKAVNLTVKAPVVSLLKLSPTAVKGGVVNSLGTVTLTGLTASDMTVNLTSNDTSAATVPSSVTVPAGSKTATFPITSQTVAVKKYAVIAVTTGTVSKIATLTVNP